MNGSQYRGFQVLPFWMHIYNTTGHGITGDRNINNNTSLRDMLDKEPKYHEPKSINWKYNFKILVDSVKDLLAEDLCQTLPEWVKSVRSLIKIRIKKLNGSMSTWATSILKDPNVAKHMSNLHDKCVVVPADKTPNNIVLCVNHIDCLIKEVCIDNSLGNTTYTPTTITKEEILDNHRSILCSVGISTKDEEIGFQSLYWIPRLYFHWSLHFLDHVIIIKSKVLLPQAYVTLTNVRCSL